MSHGFQLDDQGPLAYERYLVPALFEPCAQHMLALAAPVAGERALDVACGTGVVTHRLASLVGPAGSVAGIDANEKMVAVAASVPTEAVAPIEWRAADAAALPFDDGAFDLVCCQQGLPFFTDPVGALAEAHRVLVPAGRVALAVWRPIEHNPAFAALACALDRHVGAEVAALMRAPFAGPGRAQLERLLAQTSFGSAQIRIADIGARFPSPREFLRRQVVSSPLATPIGALESHRLVALADDVERVLDPYSDGDGIVLPMQTFLIAARRG